MSHYVGSAVRLTLRRKARSRTKTIPDNPSGIEHIRKFRGKQGIERGFTACTDFWSIVLRTMKTEPFPADYEIADEEKHKRALAWIDRSCDGGRSVGYRFGAY